MHTTQWLQRWLTARPVNTGGEIAAVTAVSGPGNGRRGNPFFHNRDDAGLRLADHLGAHRGMATLVLALPRGGMPVAEPVALALDADLDVLVVRKIRAPHQPELGLGAVAEDNVVEWNASMLQLLSLDAEPRRWQLERARRELADAVAQYRSAAPRAPLTDRTVILVDDGIATGGTMRAAVAAARRERPARLVVAVPGGAPAALEALAALPGVTQVVAPARPIGFTAVSRLYDDFPPVTAEAVCGALRRAHERRRAALAALTPA